MWAPLVHCAFNPTASVSCRLSVFFWHELPFVSPPPSFTIRSLQLLYIIFGMRCENK